MPDTRPMALVGAPTLQSRLHHDWSRKFFVHLPPEPAWLDHLGAAHVRSGTVLDAVTGEAGGPRDAILVAAADPEASDAKFLIWHGPKRIREETFQGLFGPQYQRIRSQAFPLLLPRVPYFVILNPRTNPTYVLPLSGFSRLGASVAVLEQLLDARVQVVDEGPWASHAYVPSLRVFVDYDGARYGVSTRKLFYDRRGRPVPVELVAREVLQRLGYDTVPTSVFHEAFVAVVGRPVHAFRPDAWPLAWRGARYSPLEWVARAQERIAWLQDAGVYAGTVRSLEALAEIPAFRSRDRLGNAATHVSRHVTRDRLRVLIESIGEVRFLAILRGLACGHHVVSADWFAYMPGTSRAFPCEVKARGDTLRPSQKSSILFGQRTGLLDYRLLEILHGPAPNTRA